MTEHGPTLMKTLDSLVNMLFRVHRSNDLGDSTSVARALGPAHRAPSPLSPARPRPPCWELSAGLRPTSEDALARASLTRKHMLSGLAKWEHPFKHGLYRMIDAQNQAENQEADAVHGLFHQAAPCQKEVSRIDSHAFLFQVLLEKGRIPK